MAHGTKSGLGKVMLFFVLFLAGCATQDTDSSVCFDDTCFSVEIADTADERARGLMFREELALDSGMLFVFESEGTYPFWMKNTLIPLDMIWINASSVVVDIETAIPCEADPCRNYGHEGLALYVLEINGGLAEELGIEIGDGVIIE